jgi:hypothetical protein
VEFERWRGVGYPSPSRRACEAGFGEVLEAAVHFSVHRTEHRTIVSCPVAIVRCKGALGRELKRETEEKEAPDICARKAPDMPGDRTFCRWLTLGGAVLLQKAPDRAPDSGSVR